MLPCEYLFLACGDGKSEDTSTQQDTAVEQDADGDGVLGDADCDDNNDALGSITDDADCDGVLTAEDCDDSDASSTTTATDGDCNGVLTEDDCNDGDASSTTKATDGDCDGVLTAEDCDDSDPTAYPGIFTMDNTEEWMNYTGWAADPNGACESYCVNPCPSLEPPQIQP